MSDPHPTLGELSRLSYRWLGVSPLTTPTSTDVEADVLPAIEALALEADHVVLHVVPSAASPRPVAVLRLVPAPGSAPPQAADLARRLRAAVVLVEDHPAEPHLAGPAEATAACLQAITATRAGRAGRCVRFPGQDRLRGVLPVRRIIERSAIQDVIQDTATEPGTEARGGGTAARDHDLVDAATCLQPAFEVGRLTLRVGLAPHGLLVPSPSHAGHAAVT